MKILGAAEQYVETVVHHGNDGIPMMRCSIHAPNDGIPHPQPIHCVTTKHIDRHSCTKLLGHLSRV